MMGYMESLGTKHVNKDINYEWHLDKRVWDCDRVGLDRELCRELYRITTS